MLVVFRNHILCIDIDFRYVSTQETWGTEGGHFHGYVMISYISHIINFVPSLTSRYLSKKLKPVPTIGMDVELLTADLDPMDIDPVSGDVNENPTTLDVLFSNCSTHGCSHFCDVDIPAKFQCKNPKCKLVWHRDCMKLISEENKELENMNEFDNENSEICINCFIDKQLFWTYDYQHWNDI